MMAFSVVGGEVEVKLFKVDIFSIKIIKVTMNYEL